MFNAPHRDPHWLAVSGFAGYCQLMPFGYGRKNAAHRRGSSASQPVRCFAFRWWVLPHLRHEVPHGYSCLILFLASGVGVGAESESGIVVSQHGGDGLDVYAVLEGQGGEGVAQVMEPKVLQPGVLEDALVEGSHRIRVVHGPGSGGGEEPGGLFGCLACS